MPIAAVPGYMGKDFSTASPGLRFGMYLPLWGVNRRTGDLLWSTSDIDYAVRGQQQQEREIKCENKTSSLQQACKLTTGDRAAMQALARRQTQAAKTISSLLTLDAVTVAPFATGLGNEHPLENGFAFLNPYGLPYLPGSGIKGVLRQAASELANGEWGDAQGWNQEKNYLLKRKGDKPIELSLPDVLFGRESRDGNSDHVRGALSFWDAIPQISGDNLAVEIMTPHQSHYHQQKSDTKSGGSPSPHDSGQPNPISFLTLPPGTRLAFHVTCDAAHLARLAPDLVEGQAWRQLLTAAFEHAFEWLGFGAKTAVGYGAMQIDERATASREAAEKERREVEQKKEQQQERQKQIQTMSPVEQEIARCLDERTDPNLKEASALITALKAGRWEGETQRAIAEHVRTLMQAEPGQWREKSNKKNPVKDKEHQNTLLVMRWIDGD